MRYARREARAVLSCGVSVSIGRSPALSGKALDLSHHGLGLELSVGILPGTRAVVSLDSLMPDTWDVVPPVTATVLASRRCGRGHYRIGLVVERLPAVVEEFLSGAATPTTCLACLPDDTFQVRSALSREVLYQIAWARLEAQRFEDALTAAVLALDGDPENRFYRALVHRASAETALLNGHIGDALWQLMKAHAYAPRDPVVLNRLADLRLPTPAIAWAA
jgi:hypothetical protein